MSLTSNGITAEVIREMMPPYHLSPDLVEATYAALAPPPPGATGAWRAARIVRLNEEISSMMPANASQARTAADTLVLRELACAIALRAYDPELTALQMGRMGRTAAEMERSAEVLRRGLERTQQKPAPFFGTVLADEVNVAAVDAVWSKRAVRPVAQDAAGTLPEVNAGAAAAKMAGTTLETNVEGRGLRAMTPAATSAATPAVTSASSRAGPHVPEAESGNAATVTEAGGGDGAAVTAAGEPPADAATSSTQEGGPIPEAVVTRLGEGPGWTLDVVRPKPVAAADGSVVPGSAG